MNASRAADWSERIVILCLLAALLEGLEDAIRSHRLGERMPHEEVHRRVKELYTWQDVAERTEKV